MANDCHCEYPVAQFRELRSAELRHDATGPSGSVSGEVCGAAFCRMECSPSAERGCFSEPPQDLVERTEFQKCLCRKAFREHATHFIQKVWSEEPGLWAFPHPKNSALGRAPYRDFCARFKKALCRSGFVNPQTKKVQQQELPKLLFKPPNLSLQSLLRSPLTVKSSRNISRLGASPENRRAHLGRRFTRRDSTHRRWLMGRCPD
jgi:hypothetical protein